MSSEAPSKQRQRLSWLAKCALGIACAFVYYNHLELMTSASYLASSVGPFEFHKSLAYQTVLRWNWEALPVVPASEFPVIDADEFTREKFWEVTDNLRRPVVIRGGIADSKAVNEWNSQFFLDNYPHLNVVVRQMIDESNFRLVNATMQEFYDAFDRGSRVSIVASSGIFVKQPELLKQVLPRFESDIVDKDGVGVFINQLFVTPAGRTFHHTEFGGNLFRQISGSKKWTVIAPQYTKYLCPFFIRGSATVKPCIQDFDNDLREEWITHIPRMEVTLQPGDIIFNAPWYWHDVQAVGADKAQASVAGRIANRQASFTAAPVLSLGILVDVGIRSFTEGFSYPDNKQAAAEQLENVLLQSWTKTCLQKGRADCFHLSRDV